MNKAITSIVISVCSMFFLFSPATATNVDDAKKAAQGVRKAIEEKQFDTLWERQTSDVFKAKSSKLSFVTNLKNIAPQLQQFNSFRLMDANAAKAPTGSNIDGDLYTFNYQASNASETLVQSIIMVKDADGKFRLAGIWFTPTKK